MLPIPRRHAHYLFGVIQSGITSGVASAIASLPHKEDGSFLSHWLVAWLASWALLLPVVLLAAPYIRAAANALTREERG